jgi:DNA polymerase-1
MTLHLIDGSGYVHRAFHAIRGLRTSRGLPTNALFGLASMLRKFARETRPELCAVVLDAGRETFRNELFADYKANRPSAPADLAAQFPYVRRVAEAMGFPVLEMAGFEADDVIATLASRARAAGMDVVVVSSDKDLLQLVGPGVAVWDPAREKTYDREAVRGKLGVPPEAVRDWLALVGDASDNVPGVPGIGEKGATDLIAAHGSLEGVYEHLDDLPPRKREALVAGRDSAFLSRDLATLRTDVPVEADVAALRPGAPDRASLVDLLTELEFRALLAEVQGEGGGEVGGPRSEVEGQEGAPVPAEASLFPVPPRQPPASRGHPDALPAGNRQPDTATEVTDPAAFDAALEAIRAASEVALAAVFGARDPVEPDCAGLGIATGPDAAFVLRPPGISREDLGRLASALAGRAWSAAHYKELHQVFAARGIELPLPAIDPVLANYVVHPERETHTLDALALELLAEPLPPPKDASTAAVARRAIAAWRVRKPLAEAVEAAGLGDLVATTELPLARVLAEMETAGVKVDREALTRLSADLATDLQRLERQVIDAAGFPFNPNSPKQLADVLFGKLQLPVVRKTKTGPSTDAAVLEELADRHPVPALILEYRSLAKLRSTYAEALPSMIHARTGRVHTSYNQMVAATGRLSSSDPNLQNIPVRTEAGRKIRRAFVSADGHEFVAADYSQIELRVLAHLSGDGQLAEAFHAGLDIHRRTAARLFHAGEAEVTPDQRRVAKVVNFGLLYGMGAFRLGRDLKIPVGEAQGIIDEYFAAFPDVRRYLDGTLETARATGRVPMLSGRHREIPGISSSNRNERLAAERMALNAPIQGTAADVIKVAMVRLRERLLADRLDARMVMQVHDELVLEVRDGQADAVAAVLKEVMEGAYALSVPLVVEVGRGKVWSDL